MRKLLEHQADRIEAVLAQHRVSGRVTGGTVTPRWIRFKVLPAMGERISRVKRLSDELAAALDAPSCRVARQGAAVLVEVPRNDDRPIRLVTLLEQLHDTPPVTALLGIADDGAPLLIRLPSPDVAHILVAGGSGAGKTNLLQAIALSLALRHPRREELGLVLAGEALADLAGLYHLTRPVVTGDLQGAEALGSLVRLAARRAERGEALTPVVLLLDELAGPLEAGGARAEQDLAWLLRSGHLAGVHVVAGTGELDNPAVRRAIAPFPVRLVGKTATAEEARVASGWPGTGAERLLGSGDFIALAEGRSHRFQAAFATPQEVVEIVAALRRESISSGVREPVPAQLGPALGRV
jgi:S-DNA-T family DNA segregation ATPase FtsK/SpoIIIE